MSEEEPLTDEEIIFAKSLTAQNLGDYLLKKPQQFQQEMKQHQQQAMMAEVQKQKLETDGKLTVSDKDFKEAGVLAEQKFGFDLALKAVEGELNDEKLNKRVT